ncbi:hypothetical protein DEU56DRAFT_811987 [Suillus clintonianus]|uniref:uncharacterized protein n=1 Tax=Suillus clintonianus TaxID=1904413 RepID=UPI001B865527|nr:uncharacterized protein DEU56DRAFT_811987 [Suillus clintonianus]KAG2132775.1 hypothetical protein DEU56DRAFT_811987 [Suillus clintonianus]
MPAIRRGSTYLDVSTTAHTPEGRLKLDKLHAGRNLAYQNAVCTALLFICDENRDLGPADTLSVSFKDFQTTMRGRASAADMKMGSGKHPHLRRLLSFFWEHGHIDLTFAHNGRQRNVVQEIDIQPSFREIYRGFQEVLDGYGTLSAREKYRAYMSLATKVFGKDRTPTVLEAARCAFQYSRKYQDLASSLHRGRDADDSQVNTVADNEVNESDDSMDSMQSEEPLDYQVVPFTPARALSYSHSHQDIGLPTPESMPRRHVALLPPTSPASSSEVISSGNDAHSHSDRQNPQASGSRFGYISVVAGYAAGFVQGFRSSSRMFLPEISLLQTQVTDLQTSLTAAEEHLHAANRTTHASQERCLAMLEDLKNARINITDLENRASSDAVEKDKLQQEVGQLKAEVTRLQSGVEYITQFARGLMPL